MSTLLHPYDVTQEADMLQPVDFNRRSRLTHVDRVFPATLTSIIPLTEQEKLVLALYYYEEMNLKEIGQTLDISESRVSQIHTKAISRLKNRVRRAA